MNGGFASPLVMEKVHLCEQGQVAWGNACDRNAAATAILIRLLSADAAVGRAGCPKTPPKSRSSPMLGSQGLRALRLAPTTDVTKVIRPTFGFERGRPDAIPHSDPEFRVLFLKLLFDGQAGTIRGSRT